MDTLRRWIACLLLYHVILAVVFFLFGRVLPTTHWTGSLLAFGLPTVQLTWGFTVGLMVGPNRKRRAWYWTTLLFSFIPLSFVYILCFLAYHFLGLSAALTCLLISLLILFAETCLGIYYGVMVRSRCLSR